MIRFIVKLKAVGIAGLGWSHPAAMGPDIPFARRSVRKGKESCFEVYVPGSSFKGALRSAASRIAGSYGFRTCGMTKPELIKSAHGSGVCDVCDLFGVPGGPTSKVFVSDLIPQRGFKTLKVTRIRLEDSALKAAKGALFTTECVSPRAEFAGTLQVVNANVRLLALLLLALAELRLGRLGRGSLLDLRIEDDAALRNAITSEWLPLLNELEEWLWSRDS